FAIFLFFFFFYCSAAHRDLHSFPTRRSSDLGYSYGAPVFYGSFIAPTALPTSLAFLSLSTALILAAGPRHWPLRPMTGTSARARSEEHTSELQSQSNLVCRLLLEKKKKKKI